jgi:drug/metabolite transporter (DMT)-like permease
MKERHPYATFMMWLTAAIWGFAFVAQRKGMESLGPFAFNGIRFIIGGLALIPLMIYLKKKHPRREKIKFKHLIHTLPVGVVLFAASALQQAGMQWTTAGKAGFITGLYVVLVPVIGLFIRQKIHRQLWIGAFFAAAGLYLLSVNDAFQVNKGDLLVLVSAVLWAVHVQLINHMLKSKEPLSISFFQFIICGILSLITMIILEKPEMSGIIKASIPLAYGGFISVGIAYTLQVVAQQYVEPAKASIILSFETVFAAMGGFIILNEHFTERNIFGILFMFIGIIIVQIKIVWIKSLGKYLKSLVGL